MPDNNINSEINKLIDNPKLDKKLEEENWGLWESIWTLAALKYFQKGVKIQSELFKVPLPSMKLQNDKAMKYFEKHGMELVKTLSEADKNSFKKILRDNWNENPRVLSKKFNESYTVSDKRLYTIARTEAHTAFEAARNDLAQDMQKAGRHVKKMHIHSGNPRPRPSHLAADGEVRELDQDFSYGQPFPYAPHCTCIVEYIDAGKK